MLSLERLSPYLWRIPRHARAVASSCTARAQRGPFRPETFGSTCHGAGPVMSRTAAVKAARGRNIADELSARGVLTRATGRHALEEEMPKAYKDVQDVVRVVEGFGISRRVARLRPIGVVKG